MKSLGPPNKVQEAGIVVGPSANPLTTPGLPYLEDRVFLANRCQLPALKDIVTAFKFISAWDRFHSELSCFTMNWCIETNPALYSMRISETESAGHGVERYFHRSTQKAQC